ncbi:recQ-like DNA helicase BLM [Leptopilina boulardi]|uniref:recQ-like DNA helicase BLM n=1 Tax=Leptopilina boulardi TaxID=63433 RepID=UPI0021F53F13|nr:recQ-like DNA helicase BLM [Leptopilina boulardi]
MLQYCENISICRYKKMLTFYDQNHVNPDNIVIFNNENWSSTNCDICTHQNNVSFVACNTTAQKIVTCIKECNENNKFLNYKTFIPFLKGKCTVDVLLNKLHESEHFGKLCSWSDGQIKRLMLLLLSEKLISIKLLDNRDNDYNIPLTYNSNIPFLFENPTIVVDDILQMTLQLSVTNNERANFLNITLYRIKVMCYKQLRFVADLFSINEICINTYRVRNTRKLRALSKLLPTTMAEYKTNFSNNEEDVILQEWD